MKTIAAANNATAIFNALFFISISSFSKLKHKRVQWEEKRLTVLTFLSLPFTRVFFRNIRVFPARVMCPRIFHFITVFVEIQYMIRTRNDIVRKIKSCIKT